MLTFILTALLAAPAAIAPAPRTNAQFKPCVWPNTCLATPVAEYEPCVMPKKCSVVAEAQFQPCVWPNKCS